MPVPLARFACPARHDPRRDRAGDDGRRRIQLFILGATVEKLEQQVAELSTPNTPSAAPAGPTRSCSRSRALDVGPGDEVITTPFTFFATAGTIHNVGATPVFVDIDPRTYNILPDAAGAARTSKTKAVVPVDLFGQIAPIEEVMAALPGVPMIEDAAQTIGARRSIDGVWRMAGEAATVRYVQLLPIEDLGGYGDGGMMVTQDEAPRNSPPAASACTVARRCTFMMKSASIAGSMRFRRRSSAPSCRTSPAWSAKRRENAAYYDAAFAEVHDVGTPYVEPANESIFNQYTIRVERRDELQAFLKERGIGFGDLLSASAAPAAMLFVSRLQGRAVPRGPRRGGEARCCRSRSTPSSTSLAAE